MNETLPPLPHWCEEGSPFAQQMQAYARAAIQAIAPVPAVPECYIVNRGFRWDADRQQHIPQLIVEFEPVPFNALNDPKSVEGMNALAAMLSAAPQPVPAVPEGWLQAIAAVVVSLDSVERRVNGTSSHDPAEPLSTALNAARRLYSEMLSAAPQLAQQECEWTNCPRRVGGGGSMIKALELAQRMESEREVAEIVHGEANARLIAAAPELLEALRFAVHQNSHDMLMTDYELRICESAIAKAMGEKA
jgi:hypothetical protein